MSDAYGICPSVSKDYTNISIFIANTCSKITLQFTYLMKENLR